MATRLFAFRPGGQITTLAADIIEGVGAAASSAFKINLTVDLANTIVSDTSAGGTTRTIKKSEVLAALDAYKAYITKINWPPA